MFVVCSVCICMYLHKGEIIGSGVQCGWMGIGMRWWEMRLRVVVSFVNQDK